MLELRNICFSVPESDSGSESPKLQTIIDDVGFTFEQRRLLCHYRPQRVR